MIKKHEKRYIKRRTDKAFASEVVGKIYFETIDGKLTVRSRAFASALSEDLKRYADDFAVKPEFKKWRPHNRFASRRGVFSEAKCILEWS